METTTIVALATPAGSGAIGVARVSGAEAKEVVARCWKGRRVENWEARRAMLGWICDGQGEGIDQVVLTWYEGPGSFTGEDVVEIACHGGVLVTSLVVGRLQECGAKAAAPGEFSQRAFWNGKLDLTQAEAIMEMIGAKSRMALRAARNQLQGGLSGRVEQIVDGAKWVTAMLEAHIDFPEEDISPEAVGSILAKIGELEGKIGRLLATEDRGRQLRQGIPVAIVGRPNAGKSSLLNLMLGYERAIVSDEAGTTRDTIEEQVEIGGMLFRLVDTAGLRESGDKIERAGMERTRSAMSRAEIVVVVVDASVPPGPEEWEVLAGGETPVVIVRNKVDLGQVSGWEECSEWERRCEDGGEPGMAGHETGKRPPAALLDGEGRSRVAGVVDMLCAEGVGEEESGLEGLNRALVTAARGGADDWEGEMVAVNARHAEALREATGGLERARLLLEHDPEGLEFTVMGMYEALDALGAVTGRIDRDDILGVIFQQFCIGK